MYERRYAGKKAPREERPAAKQAVQRILVICSFCTEETSYRLPRGYRWDGAKLLLDNYIPESEKKSGKGNKKKAGAKGRLKPYEAQVWEF